MRQPAEVFPPGAFIAEEAEERGWSNEFVALRIGLSAREYERLLTGDMRVDCRLAIMLGALFGVDPVFFANLQMAWSRRAIR